MSDPSGHDPFTLDVAHVIPRVREVLDKAGYGQARILEVLGARELPPAGPRALVLPLWRRRTAGRTPLEVLLRVFVLQEAVAMDVFRQAVQPMDPADWGRLGLVRPAADAVVATVQLVPLGELILAADWPGQPHDRRLHVMEPGASSRTLADFTIRHPSRRTLDLGTGSGVQALLAAVHSRQVWAVDPNPRAVNVAAFNAYLNGRDNVICAQGDLFAPVEGHEFDLVVCNPPFVVSPESRYLYCQSGWPVDGFCREIVRAVPRYLREGGCCQIVSDLAHVAGEDFSRRLAGWFEGTACDAWVTYGLTLDPAAYAAHWLRETEGLDLRSCAGQFEDWIAYYDRERIEAVSFGLIAMRRRSGPHNWFYAEEAPGARTPTGDEVARRFALRDYLEQVSDDQVLLEARLRYAPELRWEQELQPAAEGWSVTGSRLRPAASWGGGEPADAGLIFVVARCRGDAPLRDILTELAAAMHQPLDCVAPACLAKVRRLIEQGLILPASGALDCAV
jgi:hypothetical protein